MDATTVKLVLDTRRKLRTGEYPIIFRLIYKRKSTQIKTGYSVKVNEWDSKKCIVKRSHSNFRNINEYLQLTLSEYNRKLLLNKKDFDNIHELKDFLTGTHENTNDFVSYTNVVINTFLNEGRYGNAKAYNNAILFLRKYFRSSGEIKFTEITPSVLKHIEAVFIGKGYSYNGLSFNMRTIRAIFNRAITENIITPDKYPFRRSSFEKDKYKIKNEKTVKRAVTKTEIIQFENYLQECEPFSMEYKAISYFLFSFYCRGINFADMAYLKEDSNIKGGYLIYMRRKTHVRYKIKLTRKALRIIDAFKQHDDKSDFLFPIIKRKGIELIYKDIYNANRLTNKYLKRVAKKIGINTNITMYVSRHTWATVADKLGVDRRIISQGLGHSSLSTTEIYINDIVSTDDLNAADELITE